MLVHFEEGEEDSKARDISHEERPITASEASHAFSAIDLSNVLSVGVVTICAMLGSSLHEVKHEGNIDVVDSRIHAS